MKNNFNFDIEEVIKNVTQKNLIQKYRPFQKAVKKYCEEKEIHEVERIKLSDDFYKLTTEQQKSSIITAIKENYPDKIDKEIFLFPHQYFYILTDKNEFFTLRSKARPFSKKEESKIESLRDCIKGIESNSFFQKAKANFINAKSFHQKGMIEVAKLIFQHKKYSGVLISHKEAKEELENLIEELQMKCQKERYFTLAPHKLERQVKIYISPSQKRTFERLNYKINEQERTEDSSTWNNEFMNWDYMEVTRKHFYIQISSKVFISACRNNKLLPKGRMIDENGNEIEVAKGRKTGCDNSHLNKCIVLINTETWEESEYSNQNELAKELGIDKGNLSKKLKNLQIGDSVKLKKVKYIIKALGAQNPCQLPYSTTTAQRAKIN